MTQKTRPGLRAGSTLAAATLALLAASGAAGPSSHREAPLITEMPKVDGTDFYMFTSYEPGQQDFVTIIANYIPLQDPYGGPNYFTMDPDARYEIKIDNDADAVEDLTFRFQFDNVLRDIKLDIGPSGNRRSVSVPLRNVGQVTAKGDPDVNDLEFYRLDLVLGSPPNQTVVPIGNGSTGAMRFAKPLDNVGDKTFPDYETYAQSHISRIVLPGGHVGRVFVGQRKDPFVVNLGETFDLVNTNPLGAPDAEQDSLADKNVTAFVLEVPKAFLQGAGGPIIGGWTTASLPRDRMLRSNPTYQNPTRETGPYVQVSRLAMPLVNELVIGLPDKDRFNASHPANDTQFADYITHPTLPALLEALFGVRAPTRFPRTDLVEVFATGLQGFNANGSFGEMQRLNLAVTPTPPSSQSRLGALGGDFAGFPNGRRPGDDVVDIALRVVMGVLLPPSDAPDGQLPYTDGAIVDSSFFETAFPYLATPLPGSPN